MIDTALADAVSSAAASMAAPVEAAGDTAAEAFGSLMDSAAKRGRKARKEGQKRTRDQVGRQRRNVRKAAKKTKKQTRKVWADFADETAARASNIVEASKGGRVAPRGKTCRTTAVLAFAGAVAVLVVVLKKRRIPARDEVQSHLAAGHDAAGLDG